MKYCTQCGAQNSSTANNCASCGASLKNDTITVGAVCPRCGSSNCQAVTQTDVSGGGYSASNGCCGYILFGPLGLLCGACGSKTKSQNTTYWICPNCNNKFKA